MKYNVVFLILCLVLVSSCRESLEGVSTRADYFVKLIGSSEDEEGYDALELPSAELVLLGTTDALEAESRMLLVKTAPNGDVIWEREYGDTNRNVTGSALDFTNDGGFILFGSSANTDTQQSDTKIFMVKVNANGTEQWRQSHAYRGLPTYGNCVLSIADGSGFVVGGYIEDGGNTNLMYGTTTAEGALNIRDTLNEKETTGAGNEVRALFEVDNAFIAVGSSTEIPSASTSQGGSNGLMFLINKASKNEGTKTTFGGVNDDFAYDVQQLSNGNFLLLGATASYAVNGGKDLFLAEVTVTANAISDPINGKYHVLGTAKDDIGYSLHVNTDNTITVCGTAGAAKQGEGLNQFIIKLNAAYQEVWKVDFGSQGEDVAYKVLEANDGGYIAVGKAGVDENNFISVVKTTKDGEFQ